jgi:glycerophosphoryl diester phosphodiesterase
MIKVGHRGAKGYEPENTLRSFKKALELGVDMIELDVYVCKSGEVVVIHDDAVNRTTNGKGLVEDKTLAELKELDAGQGEKIPILQEVLDLVNKEVKINVELKGENTAEPVSDVIEKYIKEKGWSYDDFLVSSFNYKELQKFKELNPKIKIGVLSKKIPKGFIDFAEKIKAYSVSVSINYTDEKFVKEVHERGLKVFVFAADEEKDIQKAKLLNVDYICSDFPDKI